MLPPYLLYSAFIFTDTKRPITIDALRRLDLFHLARVLGAEEPFRRYQPTERTREAGAGQLSLIDM